SPAMASFRPYTVAMLSPTRRMVPTFSTSSDESNPASSCSITLVISSARIAIVLPFFLNQCLQKFRFHPPGDKAPAAFFLQLAGKLSIVHDDAPHAPASGTPSARASGSTPAQTAR